MTLIIALSSHKASLDDTCAGLLLSSFVRLEDTVTWEESRAQVSAIALQVESATKEVLMSLSESILRRPSNPSLHI